jgi:hypothetical protein
LGLKVAACTVGEIRTDAGTLWVPNWSSTSCDLGVFVYQPTGQIATSEGSWDGDAGDGSD